MQLYIVPGAPNARKSQAVANHLGLSPEIIKKDFFRGDMNQDDYLTINPNAKTPVLVDGDLKLWESEAINTYLCQITPGQTLLPQDPKAQADVRRWQFWSVAHYNDVLGGICWQCIVKPMFFQEEPDQTMIDKAMNNFPKYLKVLNDHLEGRDYMVGNDWSLADYSVGFMEPFIWDESLPFELSDYPNVKAFYERMRDNPHWAATAVAPEQMGRAA